MFQVKIGERFYRLSEEELAKALARAGTGKTITILDYHDTDSKENSRR